MDNGVDDKGDGATDDNDDNGDGATTTTSTKMTTATAMARWTTMMTKRR